MMKDRAIFRNRFLDLVHARVLAIQDIHLMEHSLRYVLLVILNAVNAWMRVIQEIRVSAKNVLCFILFLMGHIIVREIVN